MLMPNCSFLLFNNPARLNFLSLFLQGERYDSNLPHDRRVYGCVSLERGKGILCYLLRIDSAGQAKQRYTDKQYG